MTDDILIKLADLKKQATTERSHYYTAAVLTAAIVEIERLRADNAALVDALRPFVAYGATYGFGSFIHIQNDADRAVLIAKDFIHARELVEAHDAP